MIYRETNGAPYLTDWDSTQFQEKYHFQKLPNPRVFALPLSFFHIKFPQRINHLFQPVPLLCPSKSFTLTLAPMGSECLPAYLHTCMPFSAVSKWPGQHLQTPFSVLCTLYKASLPPPPDSTVTAHKAASPGSAQQRAPLHPAHLPIRVNWGPPQLPPTALP